MIIYGIPNCDTIKKTLDWFKTNHIPYKFHDYRKDGVSSIQIRDWFDQIGIGSVINKNSTTWKELSPEEQSAAETADGAIAVIMQNPSVIKRPLIEKNGKVLITGFKVKELEKLIKNP